MPPLPAWCARKSTMRRRPSEHLAAILSPHHPYPRRAARRVLDEVESQEVVLIFSDTSLQESTIASSTSFRPS